MPGGIDASAPAAPITAGMPSEWARMAACAVRVPSSLIEPDHVLAVELHREAGRELVRDDDDLLVGGDGPELVARAAHQAVEHAELDGVEVGQALAQHGRAGEQVPVLQRLELVRRLGAEVVVADQRLDRAPGTPGPAP